MSRFVYQEDVDLFLKTTALDDKRFKEKWLAFVATLEPLPEPVVTLQVPMTKAQLLEIVTAKEYADLVVKAGSEAKLLAIAAAGRDVDVAPAVRRNG